MVRYVGTAQRHSSTCQREFGERQRRRMILRFSSVSSARGGKEAAAVAPRESWVRHLPGGIGSRSRLARTPQNKRSRQTTKCRRKKACCRAADASGAIAVVNRDTSAPVLPTSLSEGVSERASAGKRVPGKTAATSGPLEKMLSCALVSRSISIFIATAMADAMQLTRTHAHTHTHTHTRRELRNRVLRRLERPPRGSRHQNCPPSHTTPSRCGQARGRSKGGHKAAGGGLGVMNEWLGPGI